MQWILVLPAIAVFAHAGVIQGIVLEHASGRPVARTLVRLDPVPRSDGKAGQPLSTRAGRSGQFVFSRIEPGSYVLVAVRDGYFPAAHGQRLPAGRGTPIRVTEDSSLFAELRLRHKGAITGRVLDENGVGTPGVNVVAYRARLPLRSARGGVSDDRGVFRIHGLEPGKYWIRSGAYTHDDKSSWLPTFGPQGRELRDARIHPVTVDDDTAYADVSPEPGPLFSVGGFITCEKPGNVLVTLSSETGQRSSQTFCGASPGSYQFHGLAAANYELFATTQDEASSGFAEFNLSHSIQMNMGLSHLPDIEIDARLAGSNGVTDIPIKITARRQSLSETETPQEIKGRRPALAPGYWELRAQPPAGFYVESIVNMSTASRARRKAERPADQYEVFIDPRFPSRIRITISDQAAQIAGRVMAQGKPVPGSPVFLWPAAESARRSLGGPLQLLSDTEGQFRFDSLPPGDYRVLASFDVNEIDEELVEASRAAAIAAKALQTATLELPLWTAPY